MPEQKLTVMISSTALDLPAHREQVKDACLRLGMFPRMMEHLPASDTDAIAKSLEMVNHADIYLVILAYRYGYVPQTNNPEQISITEMEYNRAVQRGIPRLVFFMDRLHPITAADMDEDTKDTLEIASRKAKLEALKKRAGHERVANFFKSADELRGNVIHALIPHRERDLTTFHYVSEIPTPPEPFIAHPYTLLQTHKLVGRQPELNLLTDWVAKPESEIFKARILNIVAIGGMGKSALTWKWFNDIAPEEMKSLAGRVWWSFYESDATFENFVTRALAYVAKRPLNGVQQIAAPEREAQLLAVLNREPFLFVLDGLERILIAYARMDASRLDDTEVGKERSLRKTTDARVGSFLRKLAQLKNSRILVSSRLYPTELETEGGDSNPGSFSLKIEGLTDEAAVELWRAFGVSGSRDEVLPILTSFGKHPLLIQALAGEVKRYHRAPGNFAEWRKANSRFDPTNFPRLENAMSHVLEFALRGLNERAEQVLQTIAAFRMPTSYDTLAALLVKNSRETNRSKKKGKSNHAEISKPCNEERELDAMLTELEDRGLVGWDRRANRYDLHPIVRNVTWSGLTEDKRRGVYMNRHAYFRALPMIDNYLKVNSLEDLLPAIELYSTLIGLERYDDAEQLFIERLDSAMLYRLNSIRLRVELLEKLFPDGIDSLPRLSRLGDQSFTLNALAQGYSFGGQPGRAVLFHQRSNKIASEMKVDVGISNGLGNLSEALLLSGSIRESTATGRRALAIDHARADRDIEAISLLCVGMTLSTQGRSSESLAALSRSNRMLMMLPGSQFLSMSFSYLSQDAIWRNEHVIAHSFANRAWEVADNDRDEREFVFAARIQGEAALGLNDLATADERLHHALTRARMVNYVEEELPALVAIAELRRRQGDLKVAREFLDDVWELAERGPYPLIHADACNVLAQIERDEGNRSAATEAATKAYRLAWCDGPPFAYHWALEAAKKHLKELGAPEPEMPPFDESKFEPMPEVEIDPDDEFHAGRSSDDSSVP